MRSKIFVIILNYRNYQETLMCLKSLQRSIGGDKLSFLVVDNSEDTASGDFFSHKIPEVAYLKTKKNMGFAGGNNLGIKYAIKHKATHVLIINPDVRVETQFIHPLLENFKNSNVGIVAPAIIHKQKNILKYGLEGVMDWKLAKPSHRNVTILEDKSSIISEFVTFACVLIKVSVFKKIKYIDERFFMYFEDVDFCLRANQSGFKIILDPKVRVSHNTSSSFDVPTQKLVISFKSQLKFINKWLKFPQNILPLINALIEYPYLYLLWTYHRYKYQKNNVH